MEKLRDLGVLYWRLDADNYEKDPRLAAIRKERGYSYQVDSRLSDMKMQQCLDIQCKCFVLCW